MHRIATISSNWQPENEGVVFLEQTPGSIAFLTAADTDLQTIASCLPLLPPNFPSIRAANLLQLQQQIVIDHYAETVLQYAEVIIIRLLGGRAYWSYGLEVVREIVTKTEAKLIIIPGDDRPDPDLISHSNVSLFMVNQIWRYFTEGGPQNYAYACQFIANYCLDQNYPLEEPIAIPRVGVMNLDPILVQEKDGEKMRAKVGILFYRAHYLAGNLAPIQALCAALIARNLQPIPVYVSSLREPEIQTELLQYFQPLTAEPIQLLLNTTSFAIASFTSSLASRESWFDYAHQPSTTRLLSEVEVHQPSTTRLLSEVETCTEPCTERSRSVSRSMHQPSTITDLDIPVLQVIFSSGNETQWEQENQGLSPRDVAINVALPEIDGRIITRAVSFKSVANWQAELETNVITYVAKLDRINFVAELADNWIKLRQTPPAKRKIALILANYPNRDGRLANGVGLDTPASCVEILKSLQQYGYDIDDIPEDGDRLITLLTQGITNDLEGQYLKIVNQSLSWSEYQQYFHTLPLSVQTALTQRWSANFSLMNAEIPPPDQPEIATIPISGIQLGNIFVGIQPSRGYDLEPSLNYHAPDLEPTPNYLAFYYWLKTHFQADAIVHIGKHGNLEWLPGKSIALSDTCYPEIALGTLPNFYPFIVNDPGEGAQAKRRSHAVIIDHLTPPLTRAELYGPMLQLENLIDEYYEAESLDPSRLSLIRSRLIELIINTNLNQDLGIDQNDLKINDPPHPLNKGEFDLTNRLDTYLCELKEAQIRDGLHIFGQCPQGEQLRDLIMAIARHPSPNRVGLTRAIATELDLDFDPLTADVTTKIANLNHPIFADKNIKNIGDIIPILEAIAGALVAEIITNYRLASVVEPLHHSNIFRVIKQNNLAETSLDQELKWISNYLLPALLKTPQEITNLLTGLDGKFVPSGPSGAPTRGRSDVLPTGRNFYSVDIRAIPTETAYRVGKLAAENLIERYTQENGEYPQTIGLSVWGTATMRTGGDDIAEALALLGVQPRWDGASRRVVDLEILPISILQRPRVDVTLRISGFFRDAFPNLIELFDRAVKLVAHLDEPPELNPLAATVQKEINYWQDQGINQSEAEGRSIYRIFGSKPGAYGAGLQGLIEAQNWENDQDLARAYLLWSSYAYSSNTVNAPANYGKSSPEAFAQRLSQIQVVLHNQDNREHDLLDSDDYYQFQGGMTVAIRALTGKNPHTYFGDHSLPENPKIKLLKEEIAKVYRSRVINPKWIAGVMRHGYKGAFEIAATVDYLFAYDATANCVEDFMYQGVAEAYIFDEKVATFIQNKNPWALRDMAERLLEANQRNLWENVDQKTIDKLKRIVLDAERDIEQK